MRLNAGAEGTADVNQGCAGSRHDKDGPSTLPLVAQSIAWAYAPGAEPYAETESLEKTLAWASGELEGVMRN